MYPKRTRKKRTNRRRTERKRIMQNIINGTKRESTFVHDTKSPVIHGITAITDNIFIVRSKSIVVNLFTLIYTHENWDTRISSSQQRYRFASKIEAIASCQHKHDFRRKFRELSRIVNNPGQVKHSSKKGNGQKLDATWGKLFRLVIRQQTGQVNLAR